MPLKAGDVIAGRYLLHSPIGEGAMGAVWRAEDQTLRRQVAIKFLFVKAARDPQAMVNQFLREARIAASVQHRNVIHTQDFGTVDQYQPFMVMELLSGESLGDRFAREPKLTTEQVVHLVSLTLRGLTAVHDAGIVHRDLKPQNVFLQRDADAVYPKILDFGISRSLDQGGDRASAIATQEGLIIGTPDYMSPEQARGEADIDRRSDIYSMAVILYEGLTGRLPFEGKTVGELIVQIMTKEPPSMIEVAPHLPPALSDMVAQAMSKDREHRFSDARAMRRALLAAAESAMPQGRRALSVPPPESGGPTHAAPIPPPARAPKARDRGHEDATWGDFEGLHAPQMVDGHAPPALSAPSVPPAASPQQQRMVGRLGDELASAQRGPPAAPLPPQDRSEIDAFHIPEEPAMRPSATRAAPPPTPRRAKKAEPAPSDTDEALNPLYAGSNQAAPDLDYDRIRNGTRKSPGQAPPRQRAQGRGAVARPKIRYRRKWGVWALPLAAIGLVAYVVLQRPARSVGGTAPESGTSPTSSGPAGAGSAATQTADEELGRVRIGGKGRRADPGSEQPHMRDVVF